MALTPGTSLGVYRVGDLLGKRGMGEVYRARDEKLGRDVALKVLPEEFASDPDRFVRFEREARPLASLNPPTIAGIHGCFADSTGTASEGRTERWAGRGMPTRKGDRFLMVQMPGAAAPTGEVKPPPPVRVNIVLNWLDEVKTRALAH